jgi:dienelactone hydrolase
MRLLFVAFSFVAALTTLHLSGEVSASERLVFNSINAFDPNELLQGGDRNVNDVKIKLWGTKETPHPLILIGPSSTPNMDHEERLAKLLNKLGHSVAVIYGYQSRKSGKKFSVTSSSLSADFIYATATLIENGFGKHGFVGVGTSNGALALFNTTLKKIREKYSSIQKMSKVVTLNSVCYENFDSKVFDSDVKYLIISAEKDDSTPASACKKMSDRLLENGNKVIHYVHPNAHHNFFLTYIKNEGFLPNAKYVIPNCAVGLTGDLHQTMTVRKSGKKYQASPKNRRSIFKDCLGIGHVARTSKDGEKTIIRLIDEFVRK